MRREIRYYFIEEFVKKLLSVFIGIFFCVNVFASNDTPISVQIDNISSLPSGYYCIHVVVPYDNQACCHLPTAMGFEWINNYLVGIKKHDGSYLQFAYSTENHQKKLKQEPNWLCKINLDKSGEINVEINSSNCSYTYQ